MIKPQTIPDIIADHRQRAKAILGNGVYEDILEKEEAEDAALDHEIEADRIEAAYKRELGNVQKMREALLCIGHIAEYLEAGTIRDFNHAYRNIQDRVKIALSAPPRNCDVGTAEEQVSRYCKMCTIISRNGTRSCDYSKCNKCFAKWGQMPYEEGGAK